MNKILVIDPGKGWGHFVSKMYCYQKLAEKYNSKIVFLTKKSTQAEFYMKFSSFCDEVIYLEEPKKGLRHIINNLISFNKNIKKINQYTFENCFVFHPSIRYLFIANFSNIKNVWGLGLKFQNFFLKKNKKLYPSFFSKTIKDDNEALEFVKKITSYSSIKFKPLLSRNKNFVDTIGIIIAASGNEKRWSIQNYINVIEYLSKKKNDKFLIISGIDQLEEERIIYEKFKNKLKITYSSDKKIDEIIPHLLKCKFCIGNDTGFSHLSVNFDIETIVLYGDCPPQNYSNLIHVIDIDHDVKRSSHSINTIKVDKVLRFIENFLKFSKDKF